MSTSIEALRRQLQQLKDRHDRGELDAEALAAARAPLERELVQRVLDGDDPAAPAAAAAPPRPSRRLQAGLAVAVLALAVGGYAIKGTPQYATLAAAGPGPAAGAAAEGGEITEAQVQDMVQRLADRLKEKPDDAVGWTMLARAYSAMGRFDAAVPAFKKALELTGENPDLLADYADTLAAQANGKLDGEPMKLVRRALAVDPDNMKALALSGSAAFDARDYAAAVRDWERVERALPSDSGMLAQVRASIAQARELGGLPPAAAAPPVAQQGPALAGSGPAAPGAAVISGTVSLAPGLAAKLSPTDTVFVLARAANGPRMPLAVLRKQVKDLPLSFSLDDSMAMAPTAKISDHAQVIVSARVSKSGDAISQPGDPGGESAPVAPGAAGITIEIRDPGPAR